MAFVGKPFPWDTFTIVYHIPQKTVTLRGQENLYLQLQEGFDDIDLSLLKVFLLLCFIMLEIFYFEL